MAEHLQDPPMIITNIPTNEAYQKPFSYTGYGNTPSGYQTYVGNSKDKYLPSIDSQSMDVFDICLVPNSIADRKLVHGIVAVVQTYTPGIAYGGTMNAKVMVHRPAGSLAGYAKDWVEVPGTFVSIGTGNFGFNYMQARCFAQRQGEYVYAIMQANADYGEGVIGFKFNRSEFNQVWHQESFYLSDYSPLFDLEGEFFVSDDANPFIWHVTGSYRTLQDGNNLQQGSFMFGVIEDGSPNGTYVFRGDNYDQDPYSANYGTYTGPGTGYHFTGKAASFRQKYSIPRGEWGHGPYLVDPWKAGFYNPPEMWFYLQEYDRRGLVTGRYKIYRSQWKKGQYKRYDNPRPEAPLSYQTVIAYYTGYENGYAIPVPGGPAAYNFHPDRGRSFEEMPVTIDDDPKYNLGPHAQGGSRYPKLNQSGYAFEHDWFNQAHYVGTVGPFSGHYMFNPKQTPQAIKQNDSYGYHQGNYGLVSNASTIRDFKVIRDRKRRGVLHLIATDGSSVWFCSSGDDGRTWSRGTRAQGPHGFANVHPEVNGGYGISAYGAPIASDYYSGSQRIKAERLFENATLMGMDYGVNGATIDQVMNARLSVDRYAPGQRIGFFVVDYSGTGAGNAHNDGAIFKRGELNRHSWL